MSTTPMKKKKNKKHKHKWLFCDTCPSCGDTWEMCFDDRCGKARINSKKIIDF